MIFAIVVLITGLVVLVFAGLVFSGDVGFSVYLLISASLIVVLSIMAFHAEFKKQQNEVILDFLVSEKKVDLQVNKTTKDVDYVLLDSTYSKLFKKLKEK